ncbi:glutamate synthase subunit beta [Candidatus Haliotispira prima]|uniref:Glutamate synthase subunit beta n=1 Tax=Candidatus Haliotispira prima TaxID=3034016 RepID=A0ABY8MGS5_9SPIO|nr:glutamate synthase subunit beta [Candidatus Haliotispira prima]
MKDHFGFLEHGREGFRYRKVAQRILDFDEVAQMNEPEVISIQAQRCMNCGIPYCHSVGCPLKNLIPEWNDLVASGNWREAYERLEMTSNLSEFTGRICPAPCEDACTLAINSSAVSIRQIELAIIERAWQEGWVAESFDDIVESGKKVVVVGSGPAGLAAAQDLRRFGHKVSVLEKQDAIGGLLRYGIPDYKLPKVVIERRIGLMRQAGIEFRTNVRVGTDVGLEQLRRDYDAVILACGAEHPSDYAAEGRELSGIYWAMEYLIQVNKRRNKQPVQGELDNTISLAGKNVLILGAGDTSSDCIGSARREGAARIIQVSRQPEPPRREQSSNPAWPLTPSRHDFLEVSSAQEEYCERIWLHIPTKFHDDNGDGQIDRVTFTKVLWHKDPNNSNARPRMELLSDETFCEKIDAVLIAIGFEHTESGPLTEQMEAAGMDFDRYKNPGESQVATPDVFPVGDMVHGASLVVTVVAQGREVAARVEEYLETK